MSKTFLFQAIQFRQTVLIKIIQFSISINFVYALSNVKIFQFPKFLLTQVQFQCQNSSLSSNSVQHMYADLISKHFYFKKYCLAYVCRLDLLNSIYELNRSNLLYQVLPLQTRVDLGAIAMKGCSAFPKARALLKSHHQCH